MIEKICIDIPCLETSRMLHIYLPIDYETSDEEYPVLYMFDGHNLFYDEDATFGKSWGLKTFLDEQGYQIIIVGIECNHEGNQRLVEFSPYEFQDPQVGTIKGRGHILMDWVVGTLKPLIDEHYRTKTDKKNTGIAGSSMGGLMSLYTILHYPNVFSKAACISSFLNGLMGNIRKEIHASTLNKAQIYISWGSDEFRSKAQLALASRNNLEITNALLNKNKVYSNMIYKGKHDEASWEKELSIFLPYLFNKNKR